MPATQIYTDSVLLQKRFILMLRDVAARERLSSPALEYTVERLEQDLQAERESTLKQVCRGCGFEI